MQQNPLVFPADTHYHEGHDHDGPTVPHTGSPESPCVGTPTNLTVVGFWNASANNGKGEAWNTLSWDRVEGATGYRVYEYGALIGEVAAVPPGPGTRRPSFSVKPVAGITYTVTAVNDIGDESNESAYVLATSCKPPGAALSAAPIIGIVVTITATPEWNNGKARVFLQWRHIPNAAEYEVYRDGAVLQANIDRTYYVDGAVEPGKVYSYQVRGVGFNYQKPAPGALSVPVSATTPTGPAPKVATAPKILKLEPHNSWCIVRFSPVPGAKEYRALVKRLPGTYKYSGGSLAIDVNGLVDGDEVMIEAVDKLGPYQRMDGAMLGGHMVCGSPNVHKNGQGEPSNIPSVIAAGEWTAIKLKPLTLTGEQVFLDTFETFQPLTETRRSPSANPMLVHENDRWLFRHFNADITQSLTFHMSKHLMNTLYDGGTIGTSNPAHQMYASWVATMKQQFDTSGGKVLHVGFAVDDWFPGRRWVEAFVTKAGDDLVDIGNFESAKRKPTTSGFLIKYECQADDHWIQVFYPDATGTQQMVSFKAKRLPHPGKRTDYLDFKRTFDIYLSDSAVMVFENGVRTLSCPMPGGVIPAQYWGGNEAHIVHHLYHSSLAKTEMDKSSYPLYYHQALRGFCDSRHYGEFYGQVLNSMPGTTLAGIG
jgi:hypothetical protein